MSQIASTRKPDRKEELREAVNLLLPDILMIALAIVMIPVVLVPLLVDLPPSLRSAFTFVDYAILTVFIIEYVTKAALAPNVLRHILNPWHLLDLIVIAVPLISLVPALSLRYGSTSLVLRLLRIIRVIAVGSRAVDRRAQLNSEQAQTLAEESGPLEIQVMDSNLGNIEQNIVFGKLGSYIANPSQSWINISRVAQSDFERLSNSLNIPRLLLESELTEDSYPRIDYFEHYSLIFARIAEVQPSHQDIVRFKVDRKGILVICQGQNIITLSKTKTTLFDQIIEKARQVHSPTEPLTVTILYAILKHVLERDKQIVAAVEQELITLESIPSTKLPSNFLETTFHLRKEVNQLVPSLLHLKEIVSVVTSRRVPLQGFAERHEKIFNILMDEATYLHETAANARDNLQSLVDLYINTTSYQTNKVMRTIAVITSLGILPALMGLLGSNIAGNPWDIQLWQVFGLLAVLMLLMGWIFYRLGWLKG